MPVTIEWPTPTEPRRSRRGLLVFFILVAVLFLAGRTAISWWVNLLWFRSLGFGDVFWRSLWMEWGVFAVFAATTFAVLYGAFLLLLRANGAKLPDSVPFLFGGQSFQLPVARALRFGTAAMAILVSLGSGAAMASNWQTLALWWYAPTASGVADPIFGRPLGFYLFTLPAWQSLLGWMLTVAVLVTILAALFLAASGGARLLREGLKGPSGLPWRGFSFAFTFLLLALALRVYVSRFEMIFEHHQLFDGVSYTDAHVTIGGLFAVAVALLAGAMIALGTGLFQPRGRWLVLAVLPAILCYVGVTAAGWYTTTFVVRPNQLVRETPYIANNIEFTRRAWGLDRFVQREFPAETTVEAADPAANQATLQNIRLWDWRALQDTLSQLQEIKTYYNFPDIDIDRYSFPVTPKACAVVCPTQYETREVMLAARELNVDKLPENSRNWVNDKLIYTHGYGLTMNPVNGFTPEGLPTLILSNMPVQSTVPSLSVKRPEIYFGEMTSTDVYVKTHQKEFNYPEGESNNLASYEGSGGIQMGGFLRRIFIALDRGDLTKVPFSDDIGPDSRLLMRRSVRDRVQAVAPFLTFDRDPYIVLDANGRLEWILDGFTTSATYPYSSHYGDANYMRNSVKAVVDAYEGTVTLYVFDNEDPILAAWRSIFPSLFRDGSTMPAAQREHVRYPELLLQLQAEAYGLYHMTNPEVFYNGEDKWTVASENGVDASGQQGIQPMQPNFVLMKLPGEQNQEFVEVLPFTPVNRTNMIGWIAGRSDGEHYGKAIVYNFPKTRLVDGPQQIEARIDQNAQLSGQLTLWNQQGSRVVRGNLLVIPCGKTLLYAEPIYLQAQHSPMPELRLVVLALQDRLAYATSFEGALASLFGAETSSLTATETPQAPVSSATGPKPAENLNALVSQASRDFADYQRLTSAGKLAEAGQKLDDLKRTLDRLSALPR
ncbi:MAG: UPF0182 family protein [Terracidiphilus sp.]|nr:UPF0182 family protein [Terracidiphilus sp.]